MVTRNLQRSKYLKVAADDDNCDSEDENKIDLKLAYYKTSTVEKKNRKILVFKS